MPALSATEITANQTNVPAWKIENGELVRTFQFQDFLAAMRFVNELAVLAEEVSHHPDIDIRYNRVRLAMVTHDAGGLTTMDFELAQAADGLI